MSFSSSFSMIVFTLLSFNLPVHFPFSILVFPCVTSLSLVSCFSFVSLLLNLCIILVFCSSVEAFFPLTACLGLSYLSDFALLLKLCILFIFGCASFKLTKLHCMMMQPCFHCHYHLFYLPTLFVSSLDETLCLFLQFVDET